VDDLIAFLRARLDEDQADNQGDGWAESQLHRGGCETNSYSAGACDCDGPESVLADVAAKRQIIELHAGMHECPSGDGYETSGFAYFGVGEELWCTTLRLLALPHAGHPDYREEWKP
jgi:hypothetical protein